MLDANNQTFCRPFGTPTPEPTSILGLTPHGNNSRDPVGLGKRIPKTGRGSPRQWAKCIARWFTRLDSTRAEIDHIAPHALPNGKGVIFTAVDGGDGGAELESRAIAVASTATGKHTVLLRGVLARYARSGHLVYVTADGSLMAVPFDQDAMQLAGEPVALASGIPIRGGLGVPDLDISDEGTLVYTIGGSSTAGGEPVWVGRDGRAEPVVSDWTQRAGTVALSVDGTQLAVALSDDRETHLWVRHLASGGTASKLTFAGTLNIRPTWTPDGRSILFITTRGGAREAYSRRADGTADAEPLLRLSRPVQEALITRDGSWLVYRAGGGNEADLYARRTTGDTTPVVLANSAFPENSPTVSPDGRWLAYASTETGQYEVYVRPFPEAAGGKWLISVGGGTEPLWSPTGRELFYRNGKGEIVAVTVSDGGAPPTGPQRVLFAATSYSTDPQHRAYDVTQDGQRFVMARFGAGGDADELQLIVVENFLQELKRLVPR